MPTTSRVLPTTHGVLRRVLPAVLVLVVTLALPQPASAATSYSRTALTTTVRGTSVTVTTTLKASRRTVADKLGVCVRDAAGRNVDFPKRAGTLSSGATRWSGTRTYAPGVYTDYACVKVAGHWHRVGARGSFTVRAPAAPRVRSSAAFSPVTSESFDVPAAAGAVLRTYARSLEAYQDNGRYRRANLSVHDGALDIRLTRTTGAAVVLGPPDSLWGRRYGRFDVTFRVDAAAAQGAAFMLWPTSNVWSEGEIDFPEGSFDEPIHGYHHPTPCGHVEGGRLPYCGSSDVMETGVSWRSWHTASVEWVPGAVRYYLDDRLVRVVTHDVPTTDHRFTIQSAPESSRARPGHLLISSYAISAWRG